MPFVSARFVEFTEDDGTVNTDHHVVAVDHRGREWQLTVDSEVGDWLDFIAQGGVALAYEEGT